MSKIAIYPSLEDKVVLITGGASGIGESIVKKFMQQGSKVVFIDKEQRLGNDLVKKLDKFKYKALFKKCDLIDISYLKKTIKEIRKEIGKFSILINNAANDTRHDIDSVTPEYWDKRLHVNLRLYFFTIQNFFSSIIYIYFERIIFAIGKK